ncbi:DUF4834 family protein [Maribellus comscasis]|uniref:DUF4834 family protein n=1 Tax=Maribellus comscasis TaxID=2681766 RepID=A0A6I6K3E4_9BACT|nr:DUF4834 family protein [Maribellus comscasis]QGY44454.1 DUF4834 family protein [Maribellus comscasis]
MDILTILYIFNFIRTLFVIAIIYFVIRIISRYVLPLLIDKGVKNMQQKMQEQQRQNQRSTKREGEVTIEKNRRQNKNFDQDDGEYIDFEEVE